MDGRVIGRVGASGSCAVRPTDPEHNKAELLGVALDEIVVAYSRLGGRALA